MTPRQPHELQQFNIIHGHIQRAADQRALLKAGNMIQHIQTISDRERLGHSFKRRLDSFRSKK